MRYDDFVDWLESSKGMGIYSARDVKSRLKRVLIITNQSRFNEHTLEILKESKDFLDCSVSVKSQLKRSAALYSEFLKV